MDRPKEYAKFSAIILAITLAAFMLSRESLGDYLRSFMAVCLLVFGAFKLADLKMFARGFSECEPIAKRSLE